MATAKTVKFKVWNQWPFLVTMTAAATGGASWAASNLNSVLVAAVYDTVGTDIDFVGVGPGTGNNATNSSVYNAKTLNADDTVTIAWTASYRQPTYYDVFYISAAAWNFGAGTISRIARVKGNVLSAVILNPTRFYLYGVDTSAAVTITNWASISFVNMNGLVNMPPTPRKLADRAAGGDAIALSYAHTPKIMPSGGATIAPMNDTMRWEFVMMGGVPANWLSVLKWMRYCIPVCAIEQNTSTDAYIAEYYGLLKDASWIASQTHHETRAGRCHVSMLVEGETLV